MSIQRDLPANASIFTTLVFAIIALGGCVSVPDTVSGLDTEENDYLSDARERYLLEQANSLHREWEDQGLLLRNREFNHYLTGIMANISPQIQTSRIQLRFYILLSPDANAFALPNGRMYITVGLLSRLENPSQLAFIMAHELAHVVNRDSLREIYKREKTTVAAHISDLFLFGTGVAYSSFARDLFAHSQEVELSADKTAMDYLEKTNYQRLQSISALNLLKGISFDQDPEHQTHPQIETRIEQIKILLESEKDKTSMAQSDAAFLSLKQESTRKVIPLFLNNKWYRHTVQLAEKSIRLVPNDAWYWYYLAEGYRGLAEDPAAAAREKRRYFSQKDKPASLPQNNSEKVAVHIAKAKAAYKTALEKLESPALVYRGMGLLAYLEKDYRAGESYLQRYLSMNKEAWDKMYIRYILGQIRAQQ